jgi:Zn-finger nucleic acid-binding protein
MVVFEFEGIEVDHCLECGGTWLDAGELEQIGEIAGVPGGRMTEVLEGGGGGKHGKRKCVRCSTKLRIIDVKGIELDRCPRGHGLWFDSGEMRRLIGSFEEGEEGAVAHFFGEVFGKDRGAAKEGG